MSGDSLTGLRSRICLGAVLTALAVACTLAPIPTQWSGADATAGDCDNRLWEHTYFAEDRLTTVARCITTTGVVRDVHSADDADLIIELDGDRRLVNRSNNHGWLKIEAVCQGPGTQNKHREACRGYPGPWFTPPRVGTTVRVTGRYVADRSHGGHMEIHPLSHLEVLQ